MSQRDPKSILIAVEGIDGTGKSSAVPVIEEVCKRCGYDTLTTREPYTQEVIDQRASRKPVGFSLWVR